MSDAELPSNTRAFLRKYVFSVEELEILLLLHEDPSRVWSVAGVYDVILSTKASVERRLHTLVDLGLAVEMPEEPKGYRFAARSETAREVDTLASLYKLKPVRVIEAIFKKDRDPLQGFADSFKLLPPE